MSRSSLRKRWCFTLNNYSEQDVDRLYDLKEKVVYMLVGAETSETGTPHLQGFVHFARKYRFDPVKRMIGERAHLEVARGTDLENERYCQKETILIKFGEPKTCSDKGGSSLADYLPDLIRCAEADLTLKQITEEDVYLAAQYLRHHRAIKTLLSEGAHQTNVSDLAASFEGVVWKDWQKFYIDLCLNQPPHPREIHWIVDRVGGEGKSYLADYLCTQGAIVFENGKSADIKHGYEGQPIVIFDFARTSEMRINYEVIESIKNGRMFSSKYESRMKIYRKPHVLCFANFLPDIRSLSVDRWFIVDLSAPGTLTSNYRDDQ